MKEKRALSGLKVLEWGQWVSAPFCGKLLADMGAEVIKIESPGQGDPSRRAGPFPGDSRNPEKSGLFLYLNTNKLGITLNLETGEGRELFKRLIRETDILIENNQPGITSSLGLDYSSLRAENERLIMVSITPFGQKGQRKDYKSSELINIHMGGIGYISPRVKATWGMANKDASEVPPLRTPGRQSELQGGLQGAIGALGAVFARNTSGKGQHVDISIQQCFFSFITPALYRFLCMGGNLQSRMEQFPLAWYILPCKDGHFFVGWMQQAEWERFLDMMGNPDWAKSEVFKDTRSVVANWDAVAPFVIEFLMKYTGDELFKMSQERHLGFAPIKSPEAVVEWELLKERDFFIEIDHPVAGKQKYPGAPYKFMKTPWKIRQPAPKLGEHNEEVYGLRLGYEKTDVEEMIKQGTI